MSNIRKTPHQQIKGHERELSIIKKMLNITIAHMKEIWDTKKKGHRKYY